MKLEGVHHVTAITADAPRNVEFYAGLLGLRLVKKTVNQDDPTVYPPFYADEQGDPGSDITFFEYPGAHQGRAGAGMVHTVRWRVASEDALGFWQKRLDNHVLSRDDGRLTFVDPEGLRHELAVVETHDEPLVAEHPEVPAELALQGFDGVRAFSADPARSREFLERTLEFEPLTGATWEARGGRCGGRARSLPRPRRGRERPLPLARLPRSGAPPGRRGAARAAVAATRRRALVRRPRDRLPGRGNLRDELRARRRVARGFRRG